VITGRISTKKICRLFASTHNGVWKSYQTTEIKPFAIGVKVGMYLKVGKK